MIIFEDSLAAGLEKALLSVPDADRVFFFTDRNVEKAVFPLLPALRLDVESLIVMEPGEEHKNVETLCNVWNALSAGGASRRSLLVNIGGGVVTDLGGFAAATFKRGIRCINVPTTLLGAVDAASGGKTGIDFAGLKNEIGAFAMPLAVVVSSTPFASLPQEQMISGFAEVVKMAMIGDADLYNTFLASDSPLVHLDLGLRFAIEEKERIVTADPHEGGLRRVLNFGHTAGHAFESLLLARGEGISHGRAVAHGILVALILGHILLGADAAMIHTYRSHILMPLYGRLPIGCRDIEPLMELMRHDKKNHDGSITAVLLEKPGKPVVRERISESDMKAALDIYLNYF